MEFLRFGSSLPGEYFGCCACDIIQNFKQSPDTKASIQLVDGDGGAGMTIRDELAFAGPTLRDVFETRIRIGTFGLHEMPNHAFFAILTDSQCKRGYGLEWLKILKEHGFEYFRTVNNSVWNINNHIFALIRNVGNNARKDMFKPPETWTALKSVVPEPYALLNGDTAELTEKISTAQANIWDKGKLDIKTESEITKAGAPVIMAGMRTEFPPQLKSDRERKLAELKKQNIKLQVSSGSQHLY